MSTYFWLICAHISITGFFIVHEATGAMLTMFAFFMVVALWRIRREEKKRPPDIFRKGV